MLQLRYATFRLQSIVAPVECVYSNDLQNNPGVFTDPLKIYCGAPKELAYNSRSTGSKQVLLMIDAMKQTALIGLGSSLRG
jgi:hypothetical protein